MRKVVIFPRDQGAPCPPPLLILFRPSCNPPPPPPPLLKFKVSEEHSHLYLEHNFIVEHISTYIKKKFNFFLNILFFRILWGGGGRRPGSPPPPLNQQVFDSKWPPFYLNFNPRDGQSEIPCCFIVFVIYTIAMLHV